MTHWVGLTGGIGSGKSTVADLFAKYGVPVIDTDQVARDLTTHHGAAIPALRAAFGADLIDNAGNLKRNEMRRLMLAEPSVKQQLETILHPLIWQETHRRQRDTSALYGLVAIPLLAENPDFLRLVERVLVVDCAEAVQIARVKQRSGLSHEEAQALLTAQTTRDHRLHIADDVIANHGDLIALTAEVTRLHHFYSKVFSTYADHN